MLTAQLFVFYRQFIREKIQYELPFDRVPYKTIYSKNKARFNNLANLFNKYNIDIIDYIKFFVFDQKKTELDIKEDLCNNRTITFYLAYLNNIKKLSNIIKRFLDTSTFIANTCIENNIKSSKDFLQDLIAQNKLGQYCLAGKISKYYLVGIPRFDKIIPKLDYFSKCELQSLLDAYSVYQMDLINAFKQRGSKMVNPLTFVDKLIELKKFKTISEKIPQSCII